MREPGLMTVANPGVAQQGAGHDTGSFVARIVPLFTSHSARANAVAIGVRSQDNRKPCAPIAPSRTVALSRNRLSSRGPHGQNAGRAVSLLANIVALRWTEARCVP